MRTRWNRQQWLEAFSNGNAVRAQQVLGAHRTASGFCFRVWAPHAVAVSVVGAIFDETTGIYPMTAIGGGVWEIELVGVEHGVRYWYEL